MSLHVSFYFLILKCYIFSINFTNINICVCVYVCMSMLCSSKLKAISYILISEETNPNLSGKDSTSSQASQGSEGSTSSTDESDVEGGLNLSDTSSPYDSNHISSYISFQVSMHANLVWPVNVFYTKHPLGQVTGFQWLSLGSCCSMGQSWNRVCLSVILFMYLSICLHTSL